MEDTRSRHRRTKFDHFSRSADEKISIAITPVKVSHEENSENIPISTSSNLNVPKCCDEIYNLNVPKCSDEICNLNVPKCSDEINNDSTPVSSDVEQNPSPRRACLRKRKERRDSIGDGQDTKLCKSSRY